MQRTKEKKVQIINKMSDIIEKSDYYIIVGTEGIDCNTSLYLRKELKNHKNSLNVMKRTLLKKLLEKMKIENFPTISKGQTLMLLYGNDYLKGLNLLEKYKKTGLEISVPGAVIDSQIIGPVILSQVAKHDNINSLRQKAITIMRISHLRMIAVLKKLLDKKKV